MLESRTAPATPVAMERRRRRSPNRIIAFHHQLEFVQARLSLDAIVLADGLGQALAWAGRPELCHRLGLEAPWLAAAPKDGRQGMVAMLWEVCPGLDSKHLHVRSVRTEAFAEPLALCAIGDSVYLPGWMDHVAYAIRRIGRSRSHA